MESQENINNQNQPDRISMKMIWRSLLQEFNLEKGILHTVVDLALRPGQTIKEYLYEDRSKLVPPFRFLLIFVTLATIVTLSFLTQEDLVNTFEQGVKAGGGAPNLDNLDPEKKEFIDIYINNLAIANLKYFNIYLMLSVPLAALATLIIYGRKTYNFAEHLVVNSYIYGNTTVLYILMSPLFFFLPYQEVSLWYIVASFPYYCFCYYQAYPPKGWKAILIALGTFILQGIFAMILSFILTIVIAVITAWFGITMTI
jgi:hypothetical protein